MSATAVRVSAQCPDGAPPPWAPAAHSTRPAARSLAVSYFDNFSPDSGDAYLADGLTEKIISRLGQIESLIVKSRYAVGRYRGVRSTRTPVAAARAIEEYATAALRDDPRFQRLVEDSRPPEAPR